MVEIFKGEEINKSKIKVLKNIAYRRYAKEIYIEYFNDIKNVEDLAYLHGVNIEEETLVVGTDWFLCYTESNWHVQISEWVSVDNEHKFQQVAEMMTVLKIIFLQNKGKIFMADMRHDTSYAIYLKMVQKGFFQEFSHKCIIDCAAPSQVQDLKRKLMYKFSSIEDFLASDISDDYAEYYKYILHHLGFSITDKFIKKYGNTSAEPQGRVLKKEQSFVYQ